MTIFLALFQVISALKYAWTWEGGYEEENMNGVYGSLNVPSTFVMPGAREGFGSAFDFQREKFYIFGRDAAFLFADLFVYDLSSQQWTWLSGSNLGSEVYYQNHTSYPEDMPIYRTGMGMTHNSEENIIYIFNGGNGVALNDFWLFNVSNSSWNKLETYPNSTGSILPLIYYSSKSRKMILFGGDLEKDSIRTPRDNFWIYDSVDLSWKSYEIVITQKLIGLTNFCVVHHVFNDRLYVIADALYIFDFSQLKWGYRQFENSPDTRTHSYCACNYVNDNIILFKGKSSISNADLWSFDIKKTWFSLLSGSANENRQSVFSNHTKVPSLDIYPGGRSTGAGFYSVIQGKFYIFAGHSSGFLNELWSFSFKESYFVKTSEYSNVETYKFSIQPLPQPNNSVTYSNSWLLEGVLPSFLFVTFVSAIVLYYFKQRKHNDTTEQTKNTSYSSNDSSTLFTNTMGMAVPGYLEMFLTSFRLTKQIGKGGSGTIYLAEIFGKKETFIAKLVKDKFKSLSENGKISFDQEITLMEYLKSNRNIATIVGFCREPCCILMKYYENGSLQDYIYSSRMITPDILFSFVMDIANGVRFMHLKSVIHLDLKPANILVDSDENGLFLVVTDFGIAQIISGENIAAKMFQMSNLRGVSVQYASPEAFLRFRTKLLNIVAVKASDVFSFGIIIYEMLTRKGPWM